VSKENVLFIVYPIERIKQKDIVESFTQSVVRLSEIVMLEFVKDERSIWWGAFSGSLIKG
jgi:hypothetical protein